MDGGGEPYSNLSKDFHEPNSYHSKQSNTHVKLKFRGIYYSLKENKITTANKAEYTVKALVYAIKFYRR